MNTTYHEDFTRTHIMCLRDMPRLMAKNLPVTAMTIETFSRNNSTWIGLDDRTTIEMTPGALLTAHERLDDNTGLSWVSVAIFEPPAALVSQVPPNTDDLRFQLITILDDGQDGTLRIAWPLLRPRRIDQTLLIATTMPEQRRG